MRILWRWCIHSDELIIFNSSMLFLSVLIATNQVSSWKIPNILIYKIGYTETSFFLSASLFGNTLLLKVIYPSLCMHHPQFY
jgi:hypothetical protein